MISNCSSAATIGVRASRKGEVLVEFALIATVLYLLLAGILEFGRALYAAQVLQQAADAAARDLSRLPLPVSTTSSGGVTVPATLTGTNGVLNTSAVAQQVYQENLLVVDLSTLPAGQSVSDVFATAPLLNQLLMPLMIYDNSNGQNLFRYPGQIVASAMGGQTVVIPMVQYQNGTDSVIRTIPVVEEITQDPNYSKTDYDFNSPDADYSPFNLLAVKITNPAQRGLIALRINYPFQAATLAGYQKSSNDRVNGPITTTDEGGDVGPYAGSSGLGRLYAVGKTVRPFRRVLSAQAIFRREVFE